MSGFTKYFHEHFSSLSRDIKLTEEIEAESQLMDFEKNGVLLKEGDYIKYIPLVVKGLVKVYMEHENGNELLLYYIHPGQSCIMSATYCIGNQRSKVKATIEEDATIVLVPATKALEFNRKYLVWNEFYYELFSNKFQSLMHTIGLLTFNNKEARLLKYLKDRSEIEGTKVLSITHKKIAEDLGSNREVISRLLKKIEKEGLVSLGHKKIELV